MIDRDLRLHSTVRVQKPVVLRFEAGPPQLWQTAGEIGSFKEWTSATGLLAPVVLTHPGAAY